MVEFLGASTNGIGSKPHMHPCIADEHSRRKCGQQNRPEYSYCHP